MPYIYILKCADNSYYTGSTTDLALRLAQHNAGTYGGYTSKRLPVILVWSQDVQTDNEAFLLERKLKGWSRSKKEALIRGDFARLHKIVHGEWVREWEAKAHVGDGNAALS
jgi:predicted GIY-YIG superfamily endonuclease